MSEFVDGHRSDRTNCRVDPGDVLGILGPSDRPYSETVLTWIAEDGTPRTIRVRVNGQIVMEPSDAAITHWLQRQP